MTMTVLSRRLGVPNYEEQHWMLELNIIETGAVAVDPWPLVPKKHTDSYRWNWLVNALARDQQRRQLVLQKLQEDLKRDDRTILVVSDRLILAEYLYRMVKNDGSIRLLHGKIPQRERDDLWKRIGERKVRCLIATKVAENLVGSAGFNTVHLVTPCSPRSFIQRVGSVLRNHLTLQGRHDEIIRYYLDAHPWLRSTFDKSEEMMADWLRRHVP